MPNNKNRRKSYFLFSIVLIIFLSVTFGTISSFANLSTFQAAQINAFDWSITRNTNFFSALNETKLLIFPENSAAENELSQTEDKNKKTTRSTEPTLEPEANFVVNSTLDTSDANTSDTVCATAANVCTLRAAIEQANATPGNDVITFASNISAITLTSGNEIVINNAGTLQINGPGANVLTVSGNNTSRIFRTDSATVTIKDLTLTAGKAPNGALGGGAIYANGGSVTLDRVVVSQSVAGNNPTTELAPGGGVSFNGGNHVIQNSTVSGNKAYYFGGGIYNNNGVLTITNSTVSGNSGYFFGGGVYSNSNSTLRSVTIANNTVETQCVSPNSCAGSGGGFATAGGALNIGNTIIAGNMSTRIGEAVPVGPPDIAFTGNGTVVSAGNNLIGDSANDSTNTQNPITYQTSDLRDMPPLLAPLGMYGGTTPTMALMVGSPAINAGNNTNAPATDQRGAIRIVSGTIDIGAFEASISVSPTSLTNATAGDFYIQTLTASGGNNAGNYTFSVIGNSLPAGLTLSSGGTLSGTPTAAGTFNFTVKAADSDGIAGVIQYSLVIGCRYSISPSSQAFPSNGGNGTVTVTTTTGCSWTAQSNVSWIMISTGATGSGSGTVTYTVAANTGIERTGTLIIAGKTFTVTQASGCTYTLSAASANLFSGAATASVNVTTGAGCPYTAVSNNSFITVTAGSSGTGSGTVSFSVTANAGAARTGTISIGGQTFTVNQTAIPNLSINNVSQNEGDGGTTNFNFTVSLSAPSNEIITVNYGTSNVTAIAPGDYRTAQNSISFAPGDLTKTITVLVNGDTEIEENETFKITLLNATGAVITSAQGIGTILNDDASNGLDTSFDTDGIAVTTPAIYPGDGNSIAIQSNKKLLVAGRCCNTGDDGFAVARYNVDGTPDSTFDGDGVSLLQLSSGLDVANAIAIQSDNKIVLAGRSNNSFVVVRLNADGSLDSTFGSEGKVIVSFGALDYANALVIQPDGKILVGGNTQPTISGSADFAIARLNSNGSLDTTFDTDGKLTTGIKPGTSDFIKGLTLQPDGKIIAVGYTLGSSTSSGVLARYNSNGSLDTTFINQGIISDYGKVLNSVTVQADGKLVAVGSEDVGQGSNFALYRVNSDGSFDASFDRDGHVSTAFLLNAEAKSVFVQADQKLVVTGATWIYTTNGLNLNAVIARYNSDGSLDTSFDDDGKLTNSFGDRLTFNTGAGLLQSDGRIDITASSTTGNLYVARYKGNFVNIQCQYALNPTSQSFANGGGQGSITVTSTFGCPWTAQSSDLWITVGNDNSNTQSGTVSFTVAANGGAARTGTILIANQIFTVTQASAPTASINDVRMEEGNSGTTKFNFTVTLSGVATQPVSISYAVNGETAVSTSDFQFSSDVITFAPGETTKTITVLVNGDTDVEPDETFNVGLYSPVNVSIVKNKGIGTIINDDSCTYAVEPTGIGVVKTATGIAVPAAEFGAGIKIITQTGCAWTSSSNFSWINIVSNSQGSGSGGIAFTVNSNLGVARHGEIYVAGQILTVDQAAPKSRKRVTF